MIQKKTRIRKIEQQIYRKISIILQKKFESSNKFIFTITNVILSSNFIYAKIYITILNCFLNNNKKISEKKIIKKLQNNSNYIRYLLKKIINSRFIPKLIFIYDKSYKNSLYISSLINK